MKQDTDEDMYLLALLVEVYALLEVAAELKTLSSSARAAYLSEDVLDWLGTETTEPTGALPVVPKPLPWSPPVNEYNKLYQIFKVILSAYRPHLLCKACKFKTDLELSE